MVRICLAETLLPAYPHSSTALPKLTWTFDVATILTGKLAVSFTTCSSALVVCVLSLAGCSARIPTGPSQLPSSGGVTPTPSQPAPVVPETPFAALTGSYQMTLVADGCEDTFPNAYRTRTYVAQVDQNGADVTFTLPRVPPVAGATESPRIWGVMGSDHLTLTTFLGNDQWFPLYEQVEPTRLLNILIDEMTVTGSTDRLSGRWAGQFWLYEGTAATGWHLILRCESKHHGVTFTR